MLKKALFTVSLLSGIVFYSSLGFSADFNIKYKYNFEIVDDVNGGVAVYNRVVTPTNSNSKNDSSSQKSSGIVNNNSSTKKSDTQKPINTFKDFKSGIVAYF